MTVSSFYNAMACSLNSVIDYLPDHAYNSLYRPHIICFKRNGMNKNKSKMLEMNRLIIKQNKAITNTIKLKQKEYCYQINRVKQNQNHVIGLEGVKSMDLNCNN